MSNLKEIEKNVSVKYGDCKGVVELDFKDGITALDDFCEEMNISIEDKFIVGFELSDETILGMTGENIHINILYVDENVYGSSFDEIERKAVTDEYIEIQKIGKYIDIKDFLKYVKRLNLLATTTITKKVEIKILDN